MRGAFYPEGGGQAMAGRLVEAIRRYGGEVRTRSPVARIRVEKGRAAGVLEKTGACIRRAGGGVESRPRAHRSRARGGRPLLAADAGAGAGFRMSLPLFAVYVGLDVDLRERPELANTNYWIWGSTDLEGLYAQLEAGEMPREAQAYVTVISLRDPASARVTPAGHPDPTVGPDTAEGPKVRVELPLALLAASPAPDSPDLRHEGPAYRKRSGDRAGEEEGGGSHLRRALVACRPPTDPRAAATGAASGPAPAAPRRVGCTRLVRAQSAAGPSATRPPGSYHWASPARRAPPGPGERLLLGAAIPETP